MKDNAWFVGFAPRRNPDIAVASCSKADEHGKLAGRLAAQVIEAYVDKQRRLHHNLDRPDAEAGAGRRAVVQSRESQ